MNRVRNKRQWFARLLLCMFVPVLLLASVHVHQAPEQIDVDCYACQHHIHHDGHIASSQISLDDCLLCHFLTTPYVPATVVLLAFTAAFIVRANRLFYRNIMPVRHGAISLRAPPVCL